MRCNICFQRIFHKRGLGLRLCSSCISRIEPVLYTKNIALKDGSIYRCSSLFKYEGSIKYIIKALKFSKEVKQARTFISLMLESLSISSFPDLIVPVPSHPVDEIKRGFAHMDYAAHLLSNKLNVPSEKILHRKFFPIFRRSQKRKTKKERIKNLSRFYITRNADINGKNILLIDDVRTTGLTMDECAKILLLNGAAKVEAVSLALTPF